MAAAGEPAADERRMLPASDAGLPPPDPAPDLQGQAPPPGTAPRWPLHHVRRLTARTGRAIDTERDRGTGFLFLPVLLALGAALYWTLPVEPGFAILAGAAAGAFCLRLLAAGSGFAALSSTAALLVALGALAGKVETWRSGTLMLGSEIPTMLTGRVAAIERQASGRVRLTIDVESTARPALRYAPRRVRLSARAIPPSLTPGDGVAGYARLFPPSGPARPHGYDFAFESYMDGIGATGFFLSNPVEADLAGSPGWGASVTAGIGRMREAISARIMDRVGGAEGAIAAALIAGTRAGIPEDVNEDLRKTGLAHVLSISGLHMALVAGTVMATLRFLFALAPGFASRRPVKKYAAVAALLAASYYLVVCGAAVAAQRSFIMIAVMLVALLFDRAALTMRNLAISALVVIALAPHEVVGPSFQMSFAATGALIAAYAAWSERRLRRPPSGSGSRDRALLRALPAKALGYAGGIAATSLIAGTATALYAVWHFHRASPLGLAANLLAMPVVSIVVMPAAVLAGVLMPFGLDGPALDVMGWGIRVMMGIARWLAAMTPIDAVGTIPATAVLTLTAALVLATVLTTWLRLLSVPLLVVGLGLVANRELPDLFVAEDGQLVALRMADGELAVNRPRPSDFVTGIWRDAAMARTLVRPVRVDDRPVDGPGGEARSSPSSPEPQAGSSFACTGPACIARHSSGALVVWLGEGGPASGYCGVATVLVIDDATVDAPCPAGAQTAVLTKRDLARGGSAEGTFVAPADGKPATVVLRRAIAEPFRPWHLHRRFSREARGLPPYRPEPSPAATGPLRTSPVGKPAEPAQ